LQIQQRVGGIYEIYTIDGTLQQNPRHLMYQIFFTGNMNDGPEEQLNFNRCQRHQRHWHKCGGTIGRNL